MVRPGASRDPPEKEAPQCAVHNFPHNIDQCLVLAHSEFVGNFDTTPREAARQPSISLSTSLPTFLSLSRG